MLDLKIREIQRMLLLTLVLRPSPDVIGQIHAGHDFRMTKKIVACNTQ